MKSFHWAIRSTLVVGYCLPALFAAQAMPKIVVVEAKDAKAAAKALSEAEVEVKVAQALKFLDEKRAVSAGVSEELNTQLKEILGGVTPKNLAPLVIKKINADAEIIRKLLVAYDYTAMNAAQTDEAWRLANNNFFGATAQQYNRQSKKQEWRCLVTCIFGDMYVALVEPVAEKLFKQHMVAGLREKHVRGETIDARVAIALHKASNDAWLAFVKEHAAKLAQ